MESHLCRHRVYRQVGYDGLNLLSVSMLLNLKLLFVYKIICLMKQLEKDKMKVEELMDLRAFSFRKFKIGPLNFLFI